MTGASERAGTSRAKAIEYLFVRGFVDYNETPEAFVRPLEAHARTQDRARRDYRE